MKNLSNPSTHLPLFTILGCAFLLVNLKNHFTDSVWDYFCVLFIFILNVNVLINQLFKKNKEKFH